MENLKIAIKSSFEELIKKDGVLFSCEIEQDTTYDARKLHEVAINHRLAIYLEKFLATQSLFVDIEYNREGGSVKTIEGNVYRPDIIVHNRMSNENKNNYLIVECKKDIDSFEDQNKIKSFMENDKYKYKYGLKVIYRGTGIEGTLFYFENNELIKEDIIVNNL